MSDFKWDDRLVETILQCATGNVKDFVMQPRQFIIDFKNNLAEKQERGWEVMAFDNEHGGTTTYTIHDNSYWTKEKWQESLLSRMRAIHSVKRLSDGIVFSVGDSIDYGSCNLYGKEMKISRGKIERFYTMGSEMWVKGEDGCFNFPIENLSHPKKPFITEDGVELHEGCEIYGVAIQGTNNDTIWKRRFPFDRDRLHTNRKWFASKDKADEYVLMNKPIVSLSDILSVWDKDSFKTPRYYMDAPIFVRIKELAKSKLK